MISLASLDRVGDSEFRTGDLRVGARESTGVGGVTVVRGAVDAALGGVCGLILVFNGEMGLLGLLEMSVFAPTKIGGGAGAFVREVGPVSFVVASAVCRSLLVPREDPLSGLVLGLFVAFPGWNASFNFRPAEMPRIELPMLFLRGD